MIEPLVHYETPDFMLCKGAIAPGEKFYNPNRAPGDLNLFVYIISGDAIANEVIPINLGLNDLSPYFGRKLFYVGGSTGASWVCINPVPTSNRFTVEVLKNTTATLTAADGKVKYIVPVVGNITANQKEIQTMGHARIPLDKTVNLVVPDGSTCLVITKVESVSEIQAESLL